MHVIGFLMDFVKPSFTLSIGETRLTFNSAEQAWPLIEARRGQPIKISLSEPATLTRPAEVRWIGIEILHEHFAEVENSRHPPSLWISDRYSWRPLWRFAMSINHEIARETEQFLVSRFNALPLDGWIPLPGLDGVDWDHWRKDRDVMPMDFEDEEIIEEDTSGLMSASSTPKQRSWALEPVIQRKKTTLLSGEPGMGKSQIALAWAAGVTRGKGLPGFPDPADGPAGVMVNETEDDWDEDVVPRLIAAGANRKLVTGFNATDLHTHEGIVKLDAAKRKFEGQIRKPVRLLILSPYMECFGGGSTQEHAMREKLRDFKMWSAEQDIAVLGVAHLNEKGDVAGSKTHKRAARGSWKVILDEEDREKNPKKKRRLLVADKVNNTKDDFQLAYRIKGVTLKQATAEGEDIETSKIVWEDAASTIIECDDGIAASSTKRDEATDWLRARLSDGPVSSKIVLDEMKGLGFSMSTIYAAKDNLGLMSGIKGKTAEWRLP